MKQQDVADFISSGTLNPGDVEGRVVRVRYSCTLEQEKAFNRAELQKRCLLYTSRTSNRTRYARAVRHMMDHPERYEVISKGRDYSADIKGPAGCGWYIHYLKV